MGLGGTRQRVLLTGAYEERIYFTTTQSITEMSAQVDYATLFLMSAIKPLANVHLALNTIIKSTTNFRAYIIISVLYNKVQTLFYISSVSFWDLGVGESDTQLIPKKHMLLCRH